MCTYNAEVAAKIGKKDHLNTWSVCKLISDPNLNQDPDDCSLMDTPWSKHPFGRSLIDSLIDYYLSILDIQMACLLICCFASFCHNCKRFACSGKNCGILNQSNNLSNEQDKKPKLSILPKNSVSKLKNFFFHHFSFRTI